MNTFFGFFGLVGIALIFITIVTKKETSGKEWKFLAFFSFLVVPVLFTGGVINEKLDAMQKTEFCESCHVMKPYLESLKVDDDEPLSSVHYRNNYVKQENACYNCHASYAMFGGLKAKTNGLKHVWAYLTKTKIDSIKLYEPYSNDNCLHCHEPAERFLKNEDHNKEEGLLAEIKSGKKSCLANGCHDLGHYFEEKEEE